MTALRTRSVAILSALLIALTTLVGTPAHATDEPPFSEWEQGAEEPGEWIYEGCGGGGQPASESFTFEANCAMIASYCRNINFYETLPFSPIQVRLTVYACDRGSYESIQRIMFSWSDSALRRLYDGGSGDRNLRKVCGSTSTYYQLMNRSEYARGTWYSVASNNTYCAENAGISADLTGDIGPLSPDREYKEFGRF